MTKMVLNDTSGETFPHELWNKDMGADGALQLDETSFTVRVIYSALVPKTAGRFVDIPISGVTPSKDSCVCIPVVPYLTTGQQVSAIAFTPYVYEGYVRVFSEAQQQLRGRPEQLPRDL